MRQHFSSAFGKSPVRRDIAAACLVALLSAPAMAGQDRPEPRHWVSGAYSFSAELGGFRIVSVSGRGTKSDPIVIEEELDSSTPVTLVIRTVLPIRPFDYSGNFANGFLHVRIEARNNSGQPWIEFEFELQEQLNRASVFGDGLSFDQRRGDSEHIASANFLYFSRDFEPYDRLLFRGGKIDHREVASFEFMITDFTPRWEFFLVQDPRIPSS